MARPPYQAEQKDWIFARFINAAAEIMEEEGVESLTLRKVSGRAGYNSATLYNYFNDLEHLVACASVRWLLACWENMSRALAGM